MDEPTWTGDELTIDLEVLRPSHAAEMFPGLQQAEAYKFLPGESPKSVEALHERYIRLSKGMSPDGSERWLNWVIRASAAGLALGYTQATIRGEKALIAYHVFPNYWRRGVGSAAVSRMLDLLSSMGVTVATALVDTRNTASCALLERLGFTCIREIAAADEFKGSVSDEWEYQLSIRDRRGFRTSPMG